ncbi:hypothetical protein D623_10001466 [Myotis brandtii]|uniref:Uncharacterized protein n=1 Tax=Myotis brandtii TaxID=109478 RepID=S7Q2L3_MYOBR|nr:hypothetical protein D623_10001466 [Myotis brandtii]
MDDAKDGANSPGGRRTSRGLGPRRGLARFLENLEDYGQEVKGRALRRFWQEERGRSDFRCRTEVTWEVDLKRASLGTRCYRPIPNA